MACGARDTAFADFVDSAAGLDVNKARSAIARFRANAPWWGHDLRSTSVDRLEIDLEKWPGLERRNQGYARLAQVTEQGCISIFFRNKSGLRASVSPAFSW